MGLNDSLSKLSEATKSLTISKETADYIRRMAIEPENSAIKTAESLDELKNLIYEESKQSREESKRNRRFNRISIFIGAATLLIAIAGLFVSIAGLIAEIK